MGIVIWETPFTAVITTFFINECTEKRIQRKMFGSIKFTDLSYFRKGKASFDNCETITYSIQSKVEKALLN